MPLKNRYYKLSISLWSRDNASSPSSRLKRENPAISARLILLPSPLPGNLTGATLLPRFSIEFASMRSPNASAGEKSRPPDYRAIERCSRQPRTSKRKANPTNPRKRRLQTSKSARKHGKIPSPALTFLPLSFLWHEQPPATKISSSPQNLFPQQPSPKKLPYLFPDNCPTPKKLPNQNPKHSAPSQAYFRALPAPPFAVLLSLLSCVMP